MSIFTPQGVLFDLDGTLLDTARDLGNALNFVLRELGLPEKNYQQYRCVASDGSKGMLELGLGDKVDQFDHQQLKQMFLDYYDQNICKDTVFFDGVETFIQQLDQLNIPWGIVTNKPGWLTDKLLPHFSAFDSAQVVISGDSLPVRKPDPQPLIFAAEKLGTAVEQCWYVGDAERDIQAALSAKMFAVLALYGYIDQHQDVAKWQAQMSVDNLLQLSQHLK